MSMYTSSSSRFTGDTYALLRVIAGLVFFITGTMKVFHYPVMPGYPMPPYNLFTMIGVAGTLEVVGGLLITFGLFTRPAAFILSGEMAVAYFIGHAHTSFWPTINMGIPALFLCFYFLHLAFAGAGPWSLDALLHKRKG